MAVGNDHELVEIASDLVPLATDGCTIDLVDGEASAPDRLVCVAASHVDLEQERRLFGAVADARDPRDARCRCDVRCNGERVGEVVAWGARTLSPLGEALMCRAAGHVGAILEARRQRRRADAADAGRAAIVSMVGHEIRSPLQALTVGVELMQMRIRDSVDEVPRAWLAQRCEQLERSVTRLRLVSERMLDISRLEAGCGELEPAPVDLGAVVDAVIAQLGEAAEWAGCSIIVSQDAPQVGRWDRPHLEIVVENLLTNAIKYGAGRPIDVTLCGSVDEVALEVRDHGCGILPEDMGRLFDRFFRGSTTAHHAGLGVGLWIVKLLVDAHGGEVSCESTPGSGTRFLVRLPRDVSRSDRVRGASERPPEARRR